MNQGNPTGGSRRWVMVSVAIALLLAAGWLLRGTNNSEAARNRLGYFYDAEARALIVDQDTGERSGAIRAMIFSCGECADDSARFIGWLETTASGDAATPTRAIPSTNDEGYRIALPPVESSDTELNWSPRTTQAVQQLRQRTADRCNDSTSLIACFP